jgi:hypothetical protein
VYWDKFETKFDSAPLLLFALLGQVDAVHGEEDLNRQRHGLYIAAVVQAAKSVFVVLNEGEDGWN